MITTVDKDVYDFVSKKLGGENYAVRVQRGACKSLESEVQKAILIYMLKRKKGIALHAARELQINRNTLRKLTVKHGIDPQDYTENADMKPSALKYIGVMMTNGRDDMSTVSYSHFRTLVERGWVVKRFEA